MSRKDLIAAYISGSMKQATTPSLSFVGNLLFSYSTLLCERRRDNMTGEMVYCVNTGNFSQTTSRQQSELNRQLARAEAMVMSFDCYQGEQHLPSELESITSQWKD